MNDDHAVEDILDELEGKADGQDHVSVGDTLEALGERGYGPLIFVPALIEISPIGGIPGVPTFLALIIAIFAGQIVAGRDHMWLPGFIERVRVSSKRMKESVEKVRPVARWLDRWFHGRYERLTGDFPRRVAAGVCILLCLSVPPLELLPFASTAPMAAIALFGLAMTLRDGLVMAVAFVAAAVALGVGGWLWIGR
jgi:hypothetical protein